MKTWSQPATASVRGWHGHADVCPAARSSLTLSSKTLAVPHPGSLLLPRAPRFPLRNPQSGSLQWKGHLFSLTAFPTPPANKTH